MTTSPTPNPTDAVGTVKVGRWEYPARFDTVRGVTLRNTKRDESGDWVAAIEGSFIGTAIPAQAPAPAIPGFSDETPVNHDREDLRKAYDVCYANFAATLEEVAEAVDTNPGRAKAILGELAQLGLVGPTTVNDNKEVVYQCLRTYDELNEEQAAALFEETVPADIKVRAVSTHGGKIGAQTKKPGKSSWAVGDNCPQGHLLEEGDVYVQPSGRKQCRKCRGGYASNS